MSVILKVGGNREKKWLGDPLLNRLMMGHWGEIDEMVEEIKKDDKLVREVTATLQWVEERNQGRRTDGDVERDAENLQEIKKKMAKLKEHGRGRVRLREAAMALTVIRTLAARNAGRPEANQDLLRLLDGDPIALGGQRLRNERIRRSQ